MQQNEVTVDLESPIKRGDTDIKSILIRKPKAGALRGLSLRMVLDMNTETIGVLATRICEPLLTQAEVAQIEPYDLLQIGANIAGFFTPQIAETEATSQEAIQKK